MTNEVKKVPELRFPEFDGEWEEKKLGEVVNYKNGGSFESLVKNRGVYKLITLKSVNTEGKLINSEKYIDDKCVETLRKDTLVMILSEQAPGLVGMTAIIPNNNEYVLNQRVAALVPNQFIDSQFLSKLINRNQKYFSVRSAGTKVKNISKGHVESFNFLSPDYTEQQKIGEFFSKLDRQIELEEKKLELLEQQKRGYMQKIFSQELRFKDENGNEYPEWKERKFSELLSYSSNGVDKKINKNHDIAYMVNYMDVFKKTKLNTKNRDLLMEITATKIQKEKNNLKKGDILFTPSSETREDIAKSTVVFEDLDNTVYSYHLIRLRPLDSNIFSLKYSNYLSEQNFISKQFRRLAQGAQRYTLTKEYFENIKLNLPHIKEQEKIGDFFSKLDKVINKQSQKIDELKLRKQGFLQKMFV